MIRGVREAHTFRHRHASHIVIDRAQPPHRRQDHDVHFPTSFCKTLKTAKIQEPTRRRKLYLVWGESIRPEAVLCEIYPHFRAHRQFLQ
jgi:hypothetical protein